MSREGTIMRFLTIDFETFYSKTFSLKKLTTEEYIRSPEFEAIGVAVQVDDAEPVWFSGTKAQTKKFLSSLSTYFSSSVSFFVAILPLIFLEDFIHLGLHIGAVCRALAKHFNVCTNQRFFQLPPCLFQIRVTSNIQVG